MRVKGQNILPKVLFTLQNVVIATIMCGGRTSRDAYKTFRTFDQLQKITNERLRQTVRYAINKRYIRVTHRNGRDYLELTKEGKLVVGKLAIKSLRPPKQKIWDKKWRMVMFDIPETEKKRRDGFAGNLKRIGFLQVQKSAFVYPYPCFEELEVLGNFHQVGSYLAYMTVESMVPSTQFIKHFKLV